MLLIHERHLTQTLELKGPIQACLQIVREQLSLLETSKALELEGFREFVEGSDISVENLLEHARNNCYLRAPQIEKHGLVNRVIRPGDRGGQAAT